ncbi:hypothetical protein [Marinobacter nauticus]|uniref:Uncharacterized protein n=1 Tax=Marinobacter nauticus TaxID=2743 RepID=A0A1M2V0Y3_MARNT|nr:hypothetical protein [Marinobacter nauticus]OJT01229.1 hypothetical protein BEE62_14870 [Marinobacter nauticus]
MTEYITVAQVDQLLGTGWEGSGDKSLAVEQANAYLNTLTFKAWETQPDSVTRAGAELAKEAAAGNLFADSEGALKRKRVRADTVESEKEYQDGAVARSGALEFIDALLSPWIVKRTTTAILARL